jgi:hypothetical protein
LADAARLMALIDQHVIQIERLISGREPFGPSRPAQMPPSPSQPEPRWVWDGIDPIRGRYGHWAVPPVEPAGLRDELVLHSLYAELSRPEPEPTPFWRNRRPGSWWSQ